MVPKSGTRPRDWTEISEMIIQSGCIVLLIRCITSINSLVNLHCILAKISLVVVYIPLYMLLDSVCWYFVESFWTYIHKRYWFVVFLWWLCLFLFFLSFFLNQGSSMLIEQVGSFPSSILWKYFWRLGENPSWTWINLWNLLAKLSSPELFFLGNFLMNNELLFRIEGPFRFSTLPFY